MSGRYARVPQLSELLFYIGSIDDLLRDDDAGSADAGAAEGKAKQLLVKQLAVTGVWKLSVKSESPP